MSYVPYVDWSSCFNCLLAQNILSRGMVYLTTFMLFDNFGYCCSHQAVHQCHNGRLFINVIMDW